MSDLWPRVPLDQLVTKIGSGATPKGGNSAYKSVGIPFIRSMNVIFFGFKRDGLVYLDDAQADALRNVEVKANDVLLNITGASIGRVTLAPKDMEGARVNQHVCIIRPNGALEPRYVNAYLSSSEMQQRIWADNYGVTRQALTKQQISSFEIPLAPLPEQIRIADKLDSVLARVDACRDRLDRLPGLLKRFRQSVLSAATSGRLTEDWCEQVADPDWHATTVEALCHTAFDGPFGSKLKSDDYTLSGVRVVRLENINHLLFDASKETYISEDKYQSLSKNTLEVDDVIFSSFVDEEVRTCLYPDNLPTRAINKADCFVLRVDSSKCLPKYLCLRLACKTTYAELKKQVHGATRPRINLKQLKQYLLELPSLEEQHEIVCRVETLFAFADRLEARYAAARQRVEQLTPALLAKAFRGELMPQDPNDEPASELLKRLAATRAAAPKAKRGRLAAS